jgi:hypothetical protein
MKAISYVGKGIRFYALNQKSLTGNKVLALLSLTARLIRKPSSDLSHVTHMRKEEVSK